MSQYYNLRVKEIIKETEDSVTVVFQQPNPKIIYKSGQFLTLILPIDGEKIRRSYSLSSAYGIDEDLAVSVKKVANGKASMYLVNELKVDQMIEVMSPMGVFSIEPVSNKNRDVVLLGAGSGVTPLISILKTVLNSEPLSNVYFIYGNRNENSIIFKEKLNELKKEHGDRLNIVHILSQPISKDTIPSGRMSQSIIIKLLESFPRLNLSKAEYFICGPEGMMVEAGKAMDILKIPKENIFKESFLTSSPNESKGEVVESAEIKQQEVTIIYQGSEYKINVPPSKSILQAALDADLDLPYSCQSGLCTACMGKCTNGKIKLNDPDGLSDKEIQQGYVLICVGQPATANVVVEID